MKKNNFLIGTDPEYGIFDLTSNFAYPPINLIRDKNVNALFNKKQPEHWIFSQLIKPKTLLHMDGSALELEITPSNNPKNLWDNIQCGIELIKNLLNPFDDLEMSHLPTLPWDINKYTKENVGDEVIHLTRFGCDADLDAFDENKEQEEEDAEKHPFRYFGGHIHLGMPGELLEKTFEIPEILAMICSVYWGNLCTFNTKYNKEEKQRLYRYGKPGRYRVQNHGIEYRSPSNSWTSNYNVVKNIFISTEYIINAFNNETIGIKILNLTEDTKNAILNFDKVTCKKLYIEALKIN